MSCDTASASPRGGHSRGDDGFPRSEIAASWERSTRAGVRRDRLDVTCDPDVDPDGRIVRAARPVFGWLGHDLAGVPVTVVLADDRGRLLDDPVGGVEGSAPAGGIELARGSCWSEERVGTNAVGVALAQQGPASVRGDEHFAEPLKSLACAATPIRNPRDGGMVGVVGVSCAIEHADALMCSLARRVARDIEDGLIDDSSSEDRLLLEEFTRARRQTSGGLVAINARTMLTNAAAGWLVSPEDHPDLWRWVSTAISTGRPATAELSVTSGVTVIATCVPVTDGSATIGGLVRIAASSFIHPVDAAGVDRGTEGLGFAWQSLTKSELRVADLVAQGMTNGEVARCLFVSHHTVDFHLRQIYRKLGIGSRVQLARLAARR
jgi:sigma-54 dependent transcriptional regulator, acetoin dehydrogenase operon transcriptional activator AcoR